MQFIDKLLRLCKSNNLPRVEPASDPEHVFSNGSYLANLAGSSNILIDSWNAISEHQGDNPRYIHKTKSRPEDPDYDIIAFVSLTVAGYLQEESGSVQISEIPDFQLQCSVPTPLNEAAFSRFNSLLLKFSEVKELVEERIKEGASIVITGCCLDGSIASLFTLSLLKELDPPKHKHLHCVTFGSPLLGDNAIHKDLSSHPTWNSRFLHVVHKDERRLFLVDPTTGQSPYKPFGTFLLYSDSGCACFQAPESVIELLKHESCGDGESRTFDYNSLIEWFERMPFASNCSSFLGHEVDSFKAGIAAQLTALVQEPNEYISALTGKIVEHELKVIKQQREEFDPLNELDEMKVYLALMEWYMEKCRAKGEGPGYYDSFKNAQERRDNGADKYKTYLTDYWEKVVEEAKKNPATRKVPLRNRLVFAGHNYRKIVEPLDIAEYYRRGRSDYKERGRSEHYELLEKWLEEHLKKKKPQSKEENPPASADPSQSEVENPPASTGPSQSEVASAGPSQPAGPSQSKVKNPPASKVEKVMEDSCFWARVEEAIRSCRRLEINRAGEEEASLKGFEQYVMDLIKNRKVSPDIFLERSSYMQWWREYKEILKDVKGGSDSHRSELADYMESDDYKKYGEKPQPIEVRIRLTRPIRFLRLL